MIRLLFLGILCIVSTLFAATPPCAPRQPFRQPAPTNDDLLQLLRGALQGDRDAQFRAGFSYESGCGVPQSFEQAVYWYRKAAENGHPVAQNSLGTLYLRGLGVEQSDAEAMRWYLRSASEGFAPAQNNVGYMYETGRARGNDSGSSLTDDEAIKWYRRAAASGSAAGDLNLGRVYLNGIAFGRTLLRP